MVGDGARMHGLRLANINFRKAVFRDADLTGATFERSSLIGADFNGPGQHIRDATNTAQYPNGPGHQGGLVWMGGSWKLRQALIERV